MTVKIAVPSTPEGLRETLLDKNKMVALTNQGDLPGFMTEYIKNFSKADPGTSENVQEQIDQALASFAKEHFVDLKNSGKGGKRLDLRPSDIKTGRQLGTKYSDRSDGAVLDGKFTDLMDFISTVHSAADPRDEKIGSRQKLIKDAMSSTDPSSGGFLIPEEFRTELLQVALETAVVRPRARVIPMASLRASIPMIDSTSNASSVYGGVIAFWTEEGVALTQSQPTFGQVVLEAKKLTAYTTYPNELAQDSAITVDALLNTIFPQAIAWFEDIAFMQGSGAGEPLGLFNPLNAALVTQTKESGQPTGTVLWENLVGMYARMLPSSLGSAVWVVSPDTFPQLATMALSVGTGGSAVWLNNGVEGPPATILGRPVLISEKVSALSTAGDINFVDFSQYLIGDRMAMDMKASTDFLFSSDMTAIRFIERVDGRPWLQSAITPRNGGSTLSPYVQLGAR